MRYRVMVLNPHTYPTVDGSQAVSEAHGVLTVTVKDGKDKKQISQKHQ